MSALSLSIACQAYDRVRALMDGRVAVEGCDLRYLRLGPEELFFRAFGHAEFDVSELSLSSYVMTLARGDAAYVAVPVFLSRMFRHSAIYVGTDRGIRAPGDLKGRLVGVPEYQVTAAVWVRGLLQDEYGVAPSDMRWRTGGLEQAGRREKLPLSLPAGIEIEPVAEGETLAGMLAAGELDAVVAPRAPSCFVRGEPGVGRLFPDYRRAEQLYFARTRLFPIMHVLGIRRSLLERNPWLASSVAKAFAQAKQIAMAELADGAALAVTLPWLAAELEASRALMGEDYWPYGVEANRPTLEALTRYTFEQGLTQRRVGVDELFAPASVERFKV